MPDKPISPGDLVQLVYSCCNDRLGMIFTVKGIRPSGFHIRCCICKQRVLNAPPGTPATDQGDPTARWPLFWLKRIPPPEELGLLEEKEELADVR